MKRITWVHPRLECGGVPRVTAAFVQVNNFVTGTNMAKQFEGKDLLQLLSRSL